MYVIALVHCIKTSTAGWNTMRTQKSLKDIYEARCARYEKHLHAGMDTTSIILKGHLFVEELLFDILKLHCRNSVPIENIKLGFSHKLSLVHAMSVSDTHRTLPTIRLV